MGPRPCYGEVYMNQLLCFTGFVQEAKQGSGSGRKEGIL